MRDRRTRQQARGQGGEGRQCLGPGPRQDDRLRTDAGARVAPPLIAECFANLECKVVDTRLVPKFDLFILEVVKAWVDPARKRLKTIHHRGYGKFVVDGPTTTLKSRMR